MKTKRRFAVEAGVNQMPEVSSARTERKSRSMAAIALIACLAAIALGVAYYRYQCGDVTLQEMDKINNGMSENQVLKIIGHPKRRYMDEGKDHWEYSWHSGPMYNGGFVIRFDDQGRVEVVLQ